METSRFSSEDIRQKIIDEATLEKQNFDKKINLAEEEAKENIFKQNQFLKIIQKQKSSVEERFEKAIDTLKNIKPANNQEKIENKHQETRPMRLENSAIVEYIDIGNKIISKDCFFVNTSLCGVLIKCNEMSREDNLEPVYLTNGRPFDSDDFFNTNGKLVNINWNANGYRIPSFEERFNYIEDGEYENECVIWEHQGVIEKFIDLGAFYFTKSSNMTELDSLNPLRFNRDKEILLMLEHNKGSIRGIYNRVSCRIVRGKKNGF